MADFKDKFTGKQYKISTFTDLSASLAAAGDNRIDGRIHEELTGRDAIAKLPFRIKQGDQAKQCARIKDPASIMRIHIQDSGLSSTYRPSIQPMVKSEDNVERR